MSIVALIPVLSQVLDKIFPDKEAADAAKLKLLDMQQSGELAKLESITELAKGQLEINKAEASSDGHYKGGWRPAIGYVCATALAYNYVAYPILVFIMSYAMPYMDVPKVNIDDNLWELITGMLGLGAMRTWEKIKK
jgi:hypothetical protein